MIYCSLYHNSADDAPYASISIDKSGLMYLASMKKMATEICKDLLDTGNDEAAKQHFDFCMDLAKVIHEMEGGEE